MNPPSTPPIPDIPFVNEMRLNSRHWLVALALIALILTGTPIVWKHLETFETGPDYRIPYNLSRDYWLYQRRLDRLTDPSTVVLLGDSVMWGEYVLPDGTLSHFLNQEAKSSDRFVNGGVNGLFPLAIEGLVDYYGKSLRHRKIILNCNLLWMSSPKADLQTRKEEKFNHSRLVPQFSPRIPCYKADANERLSVVVERNSQFMSWVTHLQTTYFGDKSIPKWTLQEDENDPPQATNAYRNPLSQISLRVPTAPVTDPQRGPASPRHQAWSHSGTNKTQFDWVTIDSSLQWGAFQRAVKKLQSRGNDILVILGPFNEHMLADESKPGYRGLHDGIADWLTRNQVTFISPEILPSDLYADASHPLTEGYHLLASHIYQSPTFQDWLRR